MKDLTADPEFLVDAHWRLDVEKRRKSRRISTNFKQNFSMHVKSVDNILPDSQGSGLIGKTNVSRFDHSQHLTSKMKFP